MNIVKVLNRKDSYSTFIAVTLGVFVASLVTTFANYVVNDIYGLFDEVEELYGTSFASSGPTGDFSVDNYLRPVIAFFVGIILIELICILIQVFAKKKR